MKAKEYYELLMSYPKNKQGFLEGASKVIDLMNNEVNELIKTRKVKYDRAVAAIIREQNDKWNAIVALFEKEHGASPLVRNSYWRSWEKQLPLLKKYYKIG